MKILVCYDGSESSLRAVNTAHQLIEDCGINEVTLVHAYTEHSRGPISNDKSGAPATLLNQLKESEKQVWLDKQDTLEEIAENFEHSRAKVNIRIEHGDAAKVIIKEAESGGYDLVVLGRRGRGGFRNMVMGSVSNAVVQGTDVSVLVVK